MACETSIANARAAIVRRLEQALGTTAMNLTSLSTMLLAVSNSAESRAALLLDREEGRNVWGGIINGPVATYRTVARDFDEVVEKTKDGAHTIQIYYERDNWTGEKEPAFIEQNLIGAKKELYTVLKAAGFKVSTKAFNGYYFNLVCER